MALLHLALSCAGTRPVHAIIIDHALRAGSAEEAEMTAQRAKAMGAQAVVMTWNHDGVKTAIQEKAREARYSLLAEACRAIGTTQILVGHTEDDQAETVGMRKDAGSGPRGLAGISERVHAPLWPQTRNLTIVRPLLFSSRADLRDYCAGEGIAYIDDPSNTDLKFARVAMRNRIASEPGLRAQLLDLGADMAKVRAQQDAQSRAWMAQHMRRVDNAGVTFARGALSDMPPGALADMLRLASGHARRVDPARIDALIGHMSIPGFKPRTLGGAIVYEVGQAIGIARDPGVLLGQRGYAPAVMPLSPNTPAVWDGRFEVMTDLPRVHIGAFWPARAQLDDAARQKLKAFPAPMRKTLPGFFDGENLLAVPSLGFLARARTFTAKDIMQSRFLRP